MVTTRCTSLEALEVCARQVYGTIEPQRTHHGDLEEEEDLPPHCMLACKKPANQVPGGAIHMRGPPFAAAGSAERCPAHGWLQRSPTVGEGGGGGKKEANPMWKHIHEHHP